MEEPVIEKKIRVGTSLIRNLSVTFYPNATMIFDELVTNARDSMAKKVEITLGPATIVIEDDGEGMSPEELKKFFYISYSEKPLHQFRYYKDMKREIIGRFGIGKMSLYQICRSFSIESKKNGKLSKAVFDFDVFEKNSYIDEFDLSVSVSKETVTGHGTKIVLSNLRQEKVPALREIVERLSKTMPISKDFKIIVKGLSSAPHIIDTSQMPIGSKYEIDTANEKAMREIFQDKWKNFVEPDIGRISGTIIYKPTEKREGGEWGVYVRVLGRLVNADNPHGIINFSGLTHARQFARKIYANLNVNSLEPALLTNRSGFIVNDPKFVRFRDNWLKRVLNFLNENESKKWIKSQFQQEGQEVSEEVTAMVHDMLEDPSLAKMLDGLSSFNAHLGNFPEIGKAAVWRGKNSMVINSAHPVYSVAKKKGKMWGVRFFAQMVAIVEIAYRKAQNLKEFKTIYDSMLAGQKIGPMRRNEGRKKK